MLKMTFRKDAVKTFKAFFESRKEKIRGFDGCCHLELWQDINHPNVLFTYSRWKDEAALTHYRNSAFFRDTWQQTRQLFEEKAEAWSVTQNVVCPNATKI